MLAKKEQILVEESLDHYCKEYFSEGCVRGLAEHDGTITAKVQGTRDYRVKLRIKNGGLDYSCTCPVGAEGDKDNRPAKTVIMSRSEH